MPDLDDSDEAFAGEGSFPEDEGFAFLTIEQVNELHDEGIRQYTPTESLAILNYGLLESAVMVPQQTWEGAFLYQSLTEMAAAYLIGLNQNHAYENGNKRVALAACSTFLRMNGFQLSLTQDEAVDLTLRIARHELEREEVVAILNGAIAPL